VAVARRRRYGIGDLLSTCIGMVIRVVSFSRYAL